MSETFTLLVFLALIFGLFFTGDAFFKLLT
jgi:hypothetical protein